MAMAMASSPALSSTVPAYHRGLLGSSVRSRRPRSIRICCSADSNSGGFDFSNLQDIPTVDLNSLRRANYNARRRLVQNRGVPSIHPEIYGQATKIEKVWKEWKKIQRESWSRGLEYMAEVEDPEDAQIIAEDGLFIERKYPEVKSKPVIITREGEILE